ncbi:MAG: hypothetical protein ABUK13_02275 [Gammaproteobacteria bacterium]
MIININRIRVLPNSVISRRKKNCSWIELQFRFDRFQLLTVVVFFRHLTRLQKITGCHTVNYAKQPESKKTYRIRTQTTDIVIDKDDTGIKDGEKEDRRNTGRYERRPQY